MMIGFFTVFRKDPRHFLLARRMLLSAQHFMPGVKIVQFTDEKTPAVPGVSRVLRRPHGKMLERRLEHYAACEGEWLFVDTDVVFQSDVRGVFEQDFDVALTDRNWPHVTHPDGFVEAMPFNTGVCFSRCPAFWKSVLATWQNFPEQQQGDWMSEQKAVAHVVRYDVFTVCVLPGMIYNYPPSLDTDAGLKEAAIVHFKGARKTMAHAGAA